MSAGHTAVLAPLVALLLSGCAARGSEAQGAAAPFAKVDLPLDAKRWLGEDTERARAAGAEPPIVLDVTALSAGDRSSGMVSVPPDACALLIARSADSVDDVDLFAYGDDGAVLGADEASTKDATLLVCPPHPKYVYVVARVAAGNGIVAVSAQRVDHAAAVRVAAAMGVRGAPGEQPASTEAWPGLEDKLTEHLRQVGGRWQPMRRAALPLDPRIVTRLSARIEPSSCVDALVVPSDEVSHVDLEAIDSEGRIVGRAAALGRDRALLICSAVPATITFEVRPHAGRGLAAVLLSRSIGGLEPDLAADVLRYDLAPIGTLEAERAALAEKLERAYGPPKLVGKGTVHVGSQSSYPLTLPAGCARVDAVLGSPGRGLEAWLWNESGELIAHEDSGGSASLFACTTGVRARLDVEAIAHAGPVAVELRKALRSDAGLTQTPLAASRLLARLLALGFVPAPTEAGSPRRLTLTAEKAAHEQSSVPVGRCVTFVAAAGPGAVGVELRLTDAGSGAEIALVRGTVSTSARACSLDRPGPIELDVRVRVAAGAADVLLASHLTSPAR